MEPETIWDYTSPLGPMVLTLDAIGVTGVRFADQRYFPKDRGGVARQTPALTELLRWLDTYFSGGKPEFTPALHLMGTPFQREVWERARQIPYGATETYGQIARELARRRGGKMSAQAVGAALAHNPVCLIVPCHRVLAADGSLTGYAGGLDRKTALLNLECPPGQQTR